MSKVLSRHFLISASVILLLPALVSAGLIHRYSFSNSAGDATSASVTDSIGGADGIVLGDGATFDGSELNLPGGSSASAAYVDLPNGLVSGLTDVTFEGWVTVQGNPAWQRIFDFGSSDLGGGNFGEVIGPGGGGEGRDYIMLSAARGTNIDQQRAEIRNEDPAGGGVATSDSNEVTPIGVPFHYALTFDADGDAPGSALYKTYRNGVEVASGTTGIQLSDLNDVNNWLGRSNWVNDANFQGSFDEFRIYDEALDNNAVGASHTLGPNVVPEPSTFILATLGFLGLMITAIRRARR